MGIVVGFVSLAPFYNHLKQEQENILRLAAETQAMEIDRAIDRGRWTSREIALDPEFNEARTAYQKGEIDESIFRDRVEKRLQTWIKESVVGIVWNDRDLGKSVRLGESVPLDRTVLSDDNTEINGPISWQGNIYAIVSPEMDDRAVFVLLKLPRETAGLATHQNGKNLGKTLLVTSRNDDTFAAISLNSKAKKESMSGFKQATIREAMARSLSGESGSLWCLECHRYIAYSPIARKDWGLLVEAEKRELYAPVYQQIRAVGSTIVVLVGMGTLGIVLLLRPLSRRMDTEIRDRDRAETAFRKERDFNKILVEFNPACFMAIDPNGIVKRANEATFRALGCRREEVVGQHFLETYIPEEERAEILAIVDRMLVDRAPVRRENHFIAKDGSKRWVDWQGQVFFNPKTDEYEYFFAAGIDITDRKRAEDELRLMHDISQAVSTASDFNSALEVALRTICQTVDWQYGEAWIPNLEGTLLEASPVYYTIENECLDRFRRYSERLLFPANTGLAGRVRSAREPEWIQDVSVEGNKLYQRHAIAVECGFKSALGVPIVAESEVLAVLAFFTMTPRLEDKRLVELVSSVAMQLGTAFRQKQTEAKYRSIFENAVEGMFQTTPEGRYLSANPALARLYGYDSPQDLIASLTDTKTQLYVHPQRHQEFVDAIEKNDYVSEFESQIYCRDGGKIWISESARAVRNDRGQLLYYEGSAIDITDRKWTEEQLFYNAFHDNLTGLANRAFFMDRLVNRVSRSQQEPDYRFAVLFLDLDGFKAINDGLGHWVGDRLLVSIAGALETCTRPRDTLARLGGDEFTILLEGVSDIEDSIAVAKNILNAVNRSFILEGQEVFTGASIGIVHSHLGYRKPSDLLRDADIALYRAKGKGKGCYVVFDAEMRDAALKRLQLETDLHRAIERQELQVYYQPIVRLDTSQIIGFESLLRWHHPSFGFISPGEFIPIAEESGIITKLGEWVLQQSCRQLAHWKQQFPDRVLSVSVNLSGKQLGANLSQQIVGILEQTGLSGKDLKLEITETALVQDTNVAIETFLQLKKYQIQLCIDDFGTGYCSLSYLHRLPVDILKIDRSFVSCLTREDERSAIVRTTLELARSLNLEAIAEGIESQSQLHRLQQLRCQYGQGYLFAKPMGDRQATQLLENSG